jgi:three-Cys-motif partner protein
MGTESFFDEQTESSKLKADMVSKYFSSWANVMAAQRSPKIAYLDLFSGPGCYKDGNPSTPLLVLEKAINHWNPRVREKIVLTFNDSNPGNFEKLKNEIEKFPHIDKLFFKPAIFNLEIGEDMVKDYEEIIKISTLSFIDPWGYKGLSLPLIKALVKDWGCDCIFFFNYRRINPGIENRALKKAISLVFTEEILNELRQEVLAKKPKEREEIILDKLKEVFKEWGMNYVLAFPFKSNSGNRTTHFLIFISKHILGYNIMKDIMGSCSSTCPQGVPSFEFNPMAAKRSQLQLFELEKPLDNLKRVLLVDFAGKSLTTKEIVEQHHMDKPYLEKNYRAALLSLESEKKIETNRSQRKARAGTFPKDMLVKFPLKRKI